MDKAKPSTEDELIRRVRLEEEAATAQLYRLHFPMVRQLVVSNSGSEEEAQDVYQEAFMHFYEQLQQPAFVLTCQAKTYLYAVCRHLWLKRLRQRGRWEPLGAQADPADLHGEGELAARKEDQHQRLEAALQLLGEPCRSLLERFYFSGESMEEIARQMCYTNAANAKNQKYKCLQRLRRLMGTYQD